jgi:hypothetical protein
MNSTLPDPGLDQRLRDVLRTVAATMDQPAAREAVPPEPAPRAAAVWRRRPARWGVAIAAGLAAVVLATIIWVRPPARPATVSASELLLAAATTAVETPILTARPDQFVFVESVSIMNMSENIAGGGSGPLEKSHGYEWLSVDGKSNGLSRGYLDDKPDKVITRTLPLPGQQNTPGYHADLPTDPAAMLRYLRNLPNDVILPSTAPALSDDWQVFFAAAQLTRGYVPPAQLSAIFAALAQVSGLTVVPNETDAAGRHGTAVRMPSKAVYPTGGWDEFLFDPTTKALLGFRSNESTSTFMTSYARLRVAIVDEAGQMP